MGMTQTKTHKCNVNLDVVLRMTLELNVHVCCHLSQRLTFTIKPPQLSLGLVFHGILEELTLHKEDH